MGDLFSDAASQRAGEVAPLAQRLRPRTLDEFVGQQHVLGEGSVLRLAIAEDRVRSSIFYGPPGSGKTTLARIVAASTGARVRGAVGGLGDREGRPRGARARTGAARHEREPDDPLPRRDPPLQQGATGRAAAGGGGGARHADRRDDGEPVLRGELGTALAHAGVRARDARAGGSRRRRAARRRGARRERCRTRSSS